MNIDSITVDANGVPKLFGKFGGWNQLGREARLSSGKLDLTETLTDEMVECGGYLSPRKENLVVWRTFNEAMFTFQVALIGEIDGNFFRVWLDA